MMGPLLAHGGPLARCRGAAVTPPTPPPPPESGRRLQHRAGSMMYSQRTGEEDLSTLWLSVNPFCSCVSVRLDGARGLPPAIDLICEVRVGQSVRLVPLLLSQADLEAGGGGRIERTSACVDAWTTSRAPVGRDRSEH